MIVTAIDPGTSQSAYVMWDGESILGAGTEPNRKLYRAVSQNAFHKAQLVAIEQVQSYGMPVGKEVFETVFWCGMFASAFGFYSVKYELVPRRDVKLHLCGKVTANDAHISRALRDLYGDKPTNKKPNPVYGGHKIKADEWQAWALAVTVWNRIHRIQGVAA